MINHPVHVDGSSRLAAFIPFCFFGDGLVGREISDFQAPVCAQFRERTVRGQLCYEADLNMYRQSGRWGEATQTGFSFIVDTAEEYNVNNLLVKQDQSRQGNYSGGFVTVYKQTVTDKGLKILLKTISKVSQYLEGL